MYADISSLATVSQQEAGIRKAKPTHLNSMTTECTDVREEGLNTGEGQKYTAKTSPSMVLVPC